MEFISSSPSSGAAVASFWMACLETGWVGWCSISMIDEKRWNHDTSSIGRKTLAGMPKASVVSSKQSWKEGIWLMWFGCQGTKSRSGQLQDCYKHKIWHHHIGRSQSSLQSLRLVWKSKDANRARTAPPTIDASVLLPAIRVLGGHYFWGSWRCMLHMWTCKRHAKNHIHGCTLYIWDMTQKPLRCIHHILKSNKLNR